MLSSALPAITLVEVNVLVTGLVVRLGTAPTMMLVRDSRPVVRLTVMTSTE